MKPKGSIERTGMGVGLLIAACGLLSLLSPASALAQARYSITDLGTLGGDNSIPIWITNTGDVVGYSETGELDSSGSPINHGFRWNKGVMQDLRTLGGNNSFAFGANNEGQVAGYADVTGGATSHAVLWYKGAITDLGTLTGPGGFSQAVLVNNRHQVVGASTTDNGGFDAVVWNRGVITDLGTFVSPPNPAVTSFGNGINDLGQVVGASQVNDVVNPILGFPPYHAALWYKGAITDLGAGPVPDAIGSAAFNINNKTQVVGRFALPDSVERAVAHAFLWESGTMHDLGIPTGLGDDNSEANSINDTGQIVGDSGLGFIESYSPNHALLWQNGDSEARVEAGESEVAEGDEGRRHGRWIDLNTLIPADSGYHLIVAFDVNARGQIVVCAVQQATGHIHAALLTPQPADDAGTSLAAATVHGADAALSLSEDARRLLALARRAKFGR